MNRDDVEKILNNADTLDYGSQSGFECEMISNLIDNIYDDFENRNCESCRWFDDHCEVCYEPIQNRINSSSFICIDSKDFCCNKWKSK